MKSTGPLKCAIKGFLCISRNSKLLFPPDSHHTIDQILFLDHDLDDGADVIFARLQLERLFVDFRFVEAEQTAFADLRPRFYLPSRYATRVFDV